MAIFLKRDTKVYLQKTVGAVSAIWEIPVLDGFTFTQANTTSEVTLNEMESSNGYSKRGRRAFNDALAPADWSFSTYIRPFKSSIAYSSVATTGTGAGGSNNTFAVEEQLWANFVGKGGWTTSASGILTLGTITIASGVNGTYQIDQNEFTTNGPGFGATFIVEVTGLTTASVSVVNPGTGYVVGNSITIPGSALGGSGNLTTTVATLTAGETSAYDSESENFTRDSTDLNISFAGSGVGTLGTFDLFFVMGATTATSLNYAASSTIEIFKLTNCVVNEATINFEVDGIAMIDWSGNASTLTTEATFNAGAAITEGTTLTSNFIRNKLTALSLVSNTGVTRTAFPGAATNGVYNITLTGGSITFSNNVTYLTPEVLGVVNQPIGHITGNKSVSGNFTAYVDFGLAGDSGSLFDAATSANARSIVTNSFALTFKVGGTSATPRFEISLPTAHLEIPTIQTEDVIAVDVAFSGLPSTITSNDEATLTYVGA
jgi:hypothetical protein